MNRLVVCLAVLLLSGNIALSREPKENDSDVNYDESKVPHYDLPPLLVSAEGKAIKTPEEWRNIRRPQILALFGNLIYGRIPEPESPIRTEFEVVRADPQRCSDSFQQRQGQSGNVGARLCAEQGDQTRAGVYEAQLQ
ncbi:MAG: hypothetical protein ACYSYM_15985 [Planctomycetota bacterium]|jgi:hypothetical protein